MSRFSVTSISKKLPKEDRRKNTIMIDTVEDLSGKNKENVLRLYSAPVKNDLNNFNGYLNCLIHIFYFIKEIRMFILTEDITSDSRYMILSELRTLFERYEEILNPDNKLGEKYRMIEPFELRRELSTLFSEEKKFLMYQNDDVADLFYIFLNSFHSFVMGLKSLKYVSDKECPKVCSEHNLIASMPCPQTCEFYSKENNNMIPKVCVAHYLFYFCLIDQVECECGAISDAYQGSYSSYIYQVELKSIFSTLKTNDYSIFKYKFFSILRNQLENNSICPLNHERCSGKAKKTTYISNTPSFFIININWNGINPQLSNICKIFFLISHQFKMTDIFEPTLINARTTRTYDLFSIIVFWNCHHISYIKHESSEESIWIKNNDMTITKFANYSEVVIDCLQSHFHPVMLFYKKIDNDKSFLIEGKEFIMEKYVKNIIEYSQKYDDNSSATYLKDVKSIKPDLSITSLNLSMNDVLKRSKEIKKKSENFMDESSSRFNKFSKSEFILKNSPLNKELNAIDYMGFSNENLFTTKKENYYNENQIENHEKANEYNLNMNDGWICEKCGNVNRPDKAECLKCKNINPVVHEQVFQNKYEKSVKKRPADEKLSINNETNKKGLESIYLTCDNCHQSNFCTRLKCEHCQKNISNETNTLNDRNKIPDNSLVNVNKREKNTNIPTNLNIPNVPANLGVFNIDNLFNILKNIKESSFKNPNDKKDILQTLPIENFNLNRKWTCSNCVKINEKILEYCEFCFNNNEKLMNLLNNAAKIILKKTTDDDVKKAFVNNKVEYISNKSQEENQDNNKVTNGKTKFQGKGKEIINYKKESYLNNRKSQIPENNQEDEEKFNERSIENLNLKRKLNAMKNNSVQHDKK